MRTGCAKAIKRRDRMEGSTLREFDAACEWAKRAHTGTSEPEPNPEAAPDRIPGRFTA